eukprot:662890-Pyramimonas_sp.AAC.1
MGLVRRHPRVFPPPRNQIGSWVGDLAQLYIGNHSAVLKQSIAVATDLVSSMRSKGHRISKKSAALTSAPELRTALRKRVAELQLPARVEAKARDLGIDVRAQWGKQEKTLERH